MKLIKFLSLFILVVLATFCSPVKKSTITLEKLRVEYQHEALGIDIAQPRFSWQMTSTVTDKGLRQTAFQIIVIDEDAKQVWDSGKMDTDNSISISYEGEPLQPTTQYTWNLNVWDQNGEVISNSAIFETGLMNADPKLSAWDGAIWIGGGDDDMVLASHYLSVFKLQYDLMLDQQFKSTKAAFVFGANDQRLMDKNLNLLGVEQEKDNSYIALELDISELSNGGQAHLNIYRVGYSPDDNADKPIRTYVIPSIIINEKNKYNSHEFLLECLFGTIEVYVNGTEEKNKITINKDQTTGRPTGSGFNLNPYGAGGNYISFPMLGDIGFRTEANQKARFSNLEIRNYRTPSNVIFSEDLNNDKSYAGIFQEAAKENFSIAGNSFELTGLTENTLVIADPSRNATPMLRAKFAVEKKSIRKARLYATARGIYEIYINGKRVGDDYFNPGLTQYNKTQMYQTYDVTSYLQSGKENVVGAWLSEGWWSGNITFNGANWNYFGDRQSLLAKLVITYDDGTEKIITSNDQDWKLYTDGPVRYGSFFQGEVYDATKEEGVKDWLTADYDDSAWRQAMEVPLEGNAMIGEYFGFANRKIVLNYDDQQLIGQIGENVKIIETLSAQSVEEVRPGVFIYDMGQNMVGFPSINITNGKAGDKVLLRYAEVRYPDLAEYSENTGMIMLENIRAALTQDSYVMKDGAQTIQPRFTFHGYRFLEISGIEEALPLEAIKGQVLSSVHKLASHFECSNPMVNKLWENITWSLKGNFLSIPTDTPARNERMGWNGDINVFSRASTYLADANQFLKRHLLAMRDMQREDGRFSDVAPVGNGFGGTLWGSAGIVLAWEAYQQYGDINLLKEHYDAMKRYVNFLDTQIDKETGILIEGPLGDWLSPENGKNDNTLLWTAYHLYDLEIMTKVAKILGKNDEAVLFQNRYAEQKRFFNTTYVKPEDHKTIYSSAITGFMVPRDQQVSKKGKLIDTQASYAIPLAFNLFDETHKAAAVENLAKAIKRKNTDDSGVERPEYSLMTGFIGTASIGEALSENGHDDIAYRLLQQEAYPSWLYPVANGATTIWERLNSFTNEEGFGGNNSMNSFNHYAFGAVAAWLYNYCLGIQRDPSHPGFQHFILKPTPDPTGQMTWAKGYYDSMYGKIVSDWKVENGQFIYKCTIPPNTTATLHLPNFTNSVQEDDLKNITESGKEIQQAEGVKYLSQTNDRILFELTSGTYEFVIKE